MDGAVSKDNGGHDSLPLRTVSRLTGLSADIIRAWERRYGVVAPTRGPRGARLYSTEDVAQLRLLRRAVSSGRAIGDIARLSRGALENLVGTARADGGPRAGAGSAGDGDPGSGDRRPRALRLDGARPRHRRCVGGTGGARLRRAGRGPVDGRGRRTLARRPPVGRRRAPGVRADAQPARRRAALARRRRAIRRCCWRRRAASGTSSACSWRAC